ncbi:hypothetical protein AFLA_006675 [Aspergillus flavus NRRL3357]|nr:hypothetical protein AFLA_006675 [Aspergillus flavus NRRL3357]
MTTVGEPHFTSSFHYTKQSSNTYHFSTLRLSQSSHAGFLKKLPYKVVVDIVHFGCYCWLCYCGTRFLAPNRLLLSHQTNCLDWAAFAFLASTITVTKHKSAQRVYLILRL